MDFQGYLDEVRDDAKQFIIDNGEGYRSFEDLYEDLCDDDSVTGNMSGSYTMSTYKAQENVSDIIYNRDFIDWVEEEAGWKFGDAMRQGAEIVDVLARYRAVGELYYDLEDFYNEHFNQEEEE